MAINAYKFLEAKDCLQPTLFLLDADVKQLQATVEKFAPVNEKLREIAASMGRTVLELQNNNRKINTAVNVLVASQL